MELLGGGAGTESAIDAAEGLGAFQLRGLDGWVFCVGIADGARALAGVEQILQSRGGSGVTEAEGLTRVTRPEGRRSWLFIDRGYLYAITLSSDGDVNEERKQVRVVRELVLKSPRAGLAAVPDLDELIRNTQRGTLYVFTPSEEGSSTGAWLASLAVHENLIELDGILRGQEALWNAKTAPVAPLLQNAPPGAFAALTVSAPVDALVSWFLGAPGSSTRQREARSLEASDVDLESFVRGLRGDVAAAAYFDGPGFLANLVQGTGRPEPKGTILMEVGVRDAAAVNVALTRYFAGFGPPVERSREPSGDLRLKTTVGGYPLDLLLKKNMMTVSIGTGMRRADGPGLAATFRQRFDLEGFLPGQVAAMVDLGQLREDLEKPRALPGVTRERFAMTQAVTATFLQKLTPVDQAYLELSPDPLGARLRGRLRLRVK
jgi:hypothetical protein